MCFRRQAVKVGSGPARGCSFQGVAEATTGLAESNGSLPPGLWCDSLHVSCVLTACTPGSPPGPTLGNGYGSGRTLSFLIIIRSLISLYKISNFFVGVFIFEPPCILIFPLIFYFESAKSITAQPNWYGKNNKRDRLVISTKFTVMNKTFKKS